ncbi:HAD-IA family hydrolase [bacterium]|nr:HAD-IA family hydrolase [bacterium]
MIKLPNTIKMVITDFDGVVTDNCVYIDENGNMSRKLNFRDVMAFSILKKNGYKIGIISGEKNSAIELIKNKFQIQHVYQDIRKKIDVLKNIIEEENLKQDEYLYMGDDINDIECLEYADYKVTVPSCVEKIKTIPDIQITTKDGGNGAFREVVDCITGT